MTNPNENPKIINVDEDNLTGLRNISIQTLLMINAYELRTALALLEGIIREYSSTVLSPDSSLEQRSKTEEYPFFEEVSALYSKIGIIGSDSNNYWVISMLLANGIYPK